MNRSNALAPLLALLLAGNSSAQTLGAVTAPRLTPGVGGFTTLVPQLGGTSFVPTFGTASLLPTLAAPSFTPALNLSLPTLAPALPAALKPAAAVPATPALSVAKTLTTGLSAASAKGADQAPALS